MKTSKKRKWTSLISTGVFGRPAGTEERSEERSELPVEPEAVEAVEVVEQVGLQAPVRVQFGRLECAHYCAKSQA